MAPSSKPVAGARRTLPILILVAISVVAGVSAALDALRFMGWAPWYTLGEVGFYNQSFFGAMLSGIVAVIWFGVAADLWRLDPKGWVFVAVIATLNIIFLLIALFGQTTWQAISVSFVLSALALVLALLPGTKAAFGMPQSAPRR